MLLLVEVFAAAQGSAAKTASPDVPISAPSPEGQTTSQKGSLQRLAIGTGPVRPPIHVLKLHEPGVSVAAPTFAVAGAFPLYFGGLIISNVHVVQVLYGAGSYVPGVQATTTPSVASFFADITQSSYFDMLGEYCTVGVAAADGTAGTNQLLGHGFFDGQFSIAPASANNGTTITDAQIQAELLAQVIPQQH